MIIGLSQRVDLNKEYNETRDCLDQNWYKVIKSNNCNVLPIPNCVKSFEAILSNVEIGGFILTGGNDISSLRGSKNISKERDEIERIILDFSMKRKLPLLGVCRGFQMMNIYLQGSLSKVTGHVNTINSVQIIENDFFKMQEIEVNSYHEWGINKKDLSSHLHPLAFASDGSIEAAYHNELNWMGIMWHPERGESQIDKDIFKKLFS
tara:strand:+ start:3917 stop:4537 length:621 start_codon:yes stop_codon:yes gene_type:complete